jgi:hypothetical protein
VNKNTAWKELSLSDESDPIFLSKLFSYLFETASDVFPEDPIENSFHMNKKQEIFIYQNNFWLKIETVKNTEEYPGFEENSGIIQ